MIYHREQLRPVAIRAISGLFVLVLIGTAVGARSEASGGAADPNVQFTTRVKPILEERCSSCHGAEEARSGLRVDSREALLRGGDRGPAIIPGKPDDSLLVKAIRHEGDLKMPRRGNLSPEEIDALVEWIRNGAPWPEDK